MITIRLDNQLHFGVGPVMPGGVREIVFVDPQSGVQVAIALDEPSAKAIAEDLLNPPPLMLPKLGLLIPPGVA